MSALKDDVDLLNRLADYMVRAPEGKEFKSALDALEVPEAARRRLYRKWSAGKDGLLNRARDLQRTREHVEQLRGAYDDGYAAGRQKGDREGYDAGFSAGYRAGVESERERAKSEALVAAARARATAPRPSIWGRLFSGRPPLWRRPL